MTTLNNLTSADFVYNEPEIEQDGYVYNFVCDDKDYNISVINAKTRERIFIIQHNMVYYTSLSCIRFPFITDDECQDNYLPEKIRQKIIAIKTINMLKG